MAKTQELIAKSDNRMVSAEIIDDIWDMQGAGTVSYTHLPLPTNREV